MGHDPNDVEIGIAALLPKAGESVKVVAVGSGKLELEIDGSTIKPPDKALPTGDPDVPGVTSQSTSQIIPITPPTGPSAAHHPAADTSCRGC
jgi:hypothetical protein